MSHFKPSQQLSDPRDPTSEADEEMYLYQFETIIKVPKDRLALTS